ncbi:hypothetical protein [Sphingobacterium sp. LRF_L2]|uniref:hypothetical protein n=1 Tax=Sphingobacterium sp. LRF_L2 TaxID=3369421 RepID=UPI003F640D33
MMYKLFFNYFIGFSFVLAIILFCGSCASLSDIDLNNTEKEIPLKTLQSNREYVFSNPAFYVGNRVIDSTQNTPFSYDMLWINFDPKFKIDGVDWIDYQVKIEIVSANKMNIKLLNASGEIIQERTKKYNKVGSFFKIKPKFWLWNNYGVVNGFESQISALSISEKGDLIVVQRSVDGAFFIVMPFAGSEVSDTYHYKPISMK